MVDVRETNARGIERLNAHDVNGFMDLIADDLQDHTPVPGYEGKDGWRRFFEDYFNAFPDLRWETAGEVVEGNKTALWGWMSGTHNNDFMGLPATGKSARWFESHSLTINDEGQISEHWGTADMAGMMQQLGLMPPPS